MAANVSPILLFILFVNTPWCQDAAASALRTNLNEDTIDERCFKDGYFYRPDSIRASAEPNCREGIWLPCKNCTLIGKCEIRPCTPKSDALCESIPPTSSRCREAKDAHRDANCFKEDYFYKRISRFDPDEPTCYHGIWQRCRNCTVMGRCVQKACSTENDTHCGPRVPDTNVCGHLNDTPGYKNSSQQLPDSGSGLPKTGQMNVASNVPLKTAGRNKSVKGTVHRQVFAAPFWKKHRDIVIPVTLIAVLAVIITICIKFLRCVKARKHIWKNNSQGGTGLSSLEPLQVSEQ